MSSKKFFGFMVALCLIGSVILSGCSKGAGGSADGIKIGVTGPLTGPTANSGIALKQGMEIAVEEWNEKGGIEIDGEKTKVKMFYEDNQGKPAQGVSAAEKLFNNENVDFLIGDAFSSSVTMAVMDLASQYEKPILSGEAVSGAISEKVEKDPDKYKYYWKGNFSSDAYGKTVYETIKSLIDSGEFKPKDKTIAFVIEDTDYGRSNVASAEELFKKDGWKVVAFETVEVGYTDFYPQLTKMKSVKPDVLVSCFTAVSSGVALAKQFNETKMTALHYGIYYPLRPEFAEEAQGAADGLLWTPLFFDPELRENQKDLAAKVKEKYNVDATGDHASGYDVMKLALSSIENAKSLDANKIVEELSKIKIDALLGTYAFEQKNHTVRAGEGFISVPTAQIQNGKNAIVWPESIATSKYQPQSWVK
ncbi:ABC transporter substrate-binding protein [Neobacillus mesonae]|nr:ABC transporter substrate-binding protein [Neobacillus mesonae]